MLSRVFIKRLVKESLVAFVVTTGGVLLASGDGLPVAALAGAAVMGLRAVVGVVVKDVGEVSDSPHL